MGYRATEPLHALEPPDCEENYRDWFSTSQPDRVGPAPQCSVCGAFLGSIRWLPPYRAELEINLGAFPDLVFGYGAGFLASQAFVDAFDAAPLTGLGHPEPVTITRVTSKRGRPPRHDPPRYAYVRPTIEPEARLDIERSGLRLLRAPECRACLSLVYTGRRRIVLEAGSRSRHDLFYATGLPGIVLVSPAFVDWFVSNRFSGGRLIPAEDYAEWYGLGPDDPQ